jgi:DNA-binding transcriptional LysR family regulator
MTAHSKTRQLNWEDLKIFLNVYRSGNIARAAKKLKLDDSTVSRRVAQLEVCLGQKLFQRTRGGMMHTQFADAIVDRLGGIELGIQGLAELVQPEEVVGTVRVAMMEGIGSLYLANKFQPFFSHYPGIRLELVTSSNYIKVGYREADLFLSFFKQSGKGIDCQKVGEFALYLYGSAEYFARFGRPKSLSDLAGHRFVTYIDDLIQMDTVRWLDEVIKTPKAQVTSSSMVAQIAFVSSGIGLGLFPKFAIPKDSGLIPLLKDSICIKRDIYISAQSDLLAVPRVLHVHQFIKSIFESDHIFLNS